MLRVCGCCGHDESMTELEPHLGSRNSRSPFRSLEVSSLSIAQSPKLQPSPRLPRGSAFGVISYTDTSEVHHGPQRPKYLACINLPSVYKNL